MRLPRFRRLQIYFTGPFILLGLISILLASTIAIRSARSVMARMASDLAQESLTGLELKLRYGYQSASQLIDMAESFLGDEQRMAQKQLWLPILLPMLHKHEFRSLSVVGLDGSSFAARVETNQEILVSLKSSATSFSYRQRLGGDLQPEAQLLTLDFHEQPWLREARALNPKLQALIADTLDTQVPALFWVKPIFDDQGQLSQVFALEMSLQDLDRTLHQLFDGKSAVGFVTDQKGRLLASSWRLEPYPDHIHHGANAFEHPDCQIRCVVRSMQNILGSLQAPDVHSTLVAGDRGLLHVAMREISSLGSLGITAFSVVPQQTYIGYVRKVVQDVFWLSLIVMILLIVAGYITSYFVTAPILKLNSSLRKVGRGQWDAVVRFERQDEIGELSRSFYKMATRLRDLVRNLEGLVDERTADLKELLEKYAEANQELERTNATKDRFFSIIAHDLKSPFTALKGYSSIIQDSFDSLSKDQLKQMVNRISVSSEEAYGLLENLLQWALIQGGSIRVNWEVFDLREVIFEVFDLMRVNAKVKDVVLSCNLDESVWIEADRNMVSTVLRNIISNSIKFTRATEGLVEVTVKQQDQEVILTIKDNGIGIKPDNLRKLFAREVYYSEKGTSNERGTGLGLGLCQEFVTMNRGRIEVESEPGRGTVFRTYWRSELNRKPIPAKPSNQNLGILYVDDSEDNHNLIAIYLKDEAWTLEFSLSGEQAIKLLETRSFDIILMDINMPGGLSGVETTREIRKLEQSMTRPASYIIAFTSSVLQSDVDAAIAAGCNSYLVKPIKKQKLIHTIQRLQSR